MRALRSPEPTPWSARDPIIWEPIRKLPLRRVQPPGPCVRVPSLAGTYRGLPPVLAFLLLLVACSDSPSEPETDDPFFGVTWAVIHLVSGTDQASPEGSFLEDPVVVRVTDGESRPLVGVPLRFSIIHGGGWLQADSSPNRTVDVLSDALGYAQVRWKLGPLPDHLLKVFISPEVNGVEPPFQGPPKYLFAGMDAPISLNWTQGLEFRTGSKTIHHDDRILETPHFLVFSDGSSDDAKIIFAAMAEESLHEIRALFSIPETDDLGIDPSNEATKITIYSNKTLQHEQKAYAFRYGFIAWGVDAGVTSLVRLRQAVKHELMHVFRMLLDGRWSVSQGSGYMWYLDSWMEEGLAEHVAGGSWYPIRTEEDLNEWRAQDDHLNPTTIRDWGFFPPSVIERSNGWEYYPMFDLAVRYLLDEDGLGKDYPDLLAMFLEMELSGAGFFYAFEKHLGISVQDYESSFYDRMEDYLPPH